MSSDRTRLYIEIIGIAAIVASLIFVGLQMRQTHEIAVVTLTQMRSDAGRELAVAQLTSEPLLTIDGKLTRGEPLSPYETLMQDMQAFVFLHQFENSHFLYTRGYITEEQWQSDLVAIRHFTATQDNYDSYWNQNKHIFRTSFVDAIDRSLAE